MTTVRAIAGREVSRQLRSPTSWLIVGSFTILCGAAFVTTLNAFLDQAGEALLVPPSQPINVNQILIRPFLLRTGLAALLVLPLITARTAAGDRRREPGAVLAGFAGALAVYVLMLLASMVPVGALFVFGSPEWGPIVSGYLGLLLSGAAFIAIGLFISSLAEAAVPAGIATFAVSLMLLAATWLARSGAPAARPVFRYFSVGDVLDDFARGIIDSRTVVSCLTIVAVGLFLTYGPPEGGPYVRGVRLQPDQRGNPLN